MNSIFYDVRYSLRMLRKNPLFLTIVVFTLAIGIGANTAIFSLLNAVLLKPLPFPDPDRLMTLWETNLKKGIPADMTSASNFIDWRQRNISFSSMAAASRLSSITLTGKGPAEQVTWSRVSYNFFDLLGVLPQHGRTFQLEEEKSGKTQIVILSHGFWVRHFGADKNVLEQFVRLDNKSFQVVGIMPERFDSPAGNTDLWAPLSLDQFAIEPIDRGQNYLTAFARLKKGINIEQAQQDLDRIAEKLSQEYPDSNRGSQIRIISLGERITGRVRPALFVAMGAVGLVLMIACANVASLVLTHFTRRSHEIGIRAALGASRKRIASQLLTESILMACCGGIVGILFARWSIFLLLRLNPEIIPRLSSVKIDGTTLIFTLGMSLITGILFGVLPALHGSEPSRSEFWKMKSGSSANSRKTNALRNRFIVFEIAIALFLLAGAGLFIRSFSYLSNVNPGFEDDHLLVARIRLNEDYATHGKQVEYFKELADRLSHTPGITDAGAVTVLPLNSFGIDFDVPYYSEGDTEPEKANAPKVKFRATTANYFRTMRIPLLHGRAFQQSDRMDSPRVVIVNESLAQQISSHASPVGKRIRFFWADWQTYEIIGVVGDTRTYGPLRSRESELFVPHAQIPYLMMNVVVRTAGDPAPMASAVRQVVLEIDPNQPVHSIETMSTLVKNSTLQERYAMFLVSLLSVISLALAIVGIYATVLFCGDAAPKRDGNPDRAGSYIKRCIENHHEANSSSYIDRNPFGTIHCVYALSLSFWPFVRNQPHRFSNFD